MSHVRKQYTGAFKAKVALAAMSGESTVAQLASLYEIHLTMINTWRKPLEDGASCFGPPGIDQILIVHLLVDHA